MKFVREMKITNEREETKNKKQKTKKNKKTHKGWKRCEHTAVYAAMYLRRYARL